MGGTGSLGEHETTMEVFPNPGQLTLNGYSIFLFCGFFTNTAVVFDGVLGPPTPRVIDSSGRSMLFELQKAD